MSKPPVRCIVIDGWHKGHMVTLPNTLPQIVLLRPQTITFDDCCDGETVADVPKGRDTYLLAFGSVDGETALYSVNGSSKALWEDRTWIVPKDKNWVEQPLYVDIHDPRATIDYSTLKEQS